MFGTAAMPRWGLNRRRLLVAAGWAVLLVVAADYARRPSSLLAFAGPGLLIVGLVASRWPRATMVLAFTLSGVYGSAKAFLSFPANGVATALILGLCVATIGNLVFGRRDYGLIVWPGAVLVLLYLILMVGDLPFSPTLGPAFKVVRTAGVYLLAVLPIAYGPWRSGTDDRVRRALVLVAAAVGAYATFRWMVGASAKERAQVSSALFNQTAIGQNKVQGSFPSGVELGAWTSMMLPFLLAVLLTMRGRVRLVALAGIPLCAIGLLGSGLRIGIVAAAVGCGVVMVCYSFGRGMPLARPAVTAAVIATVVAGGAVLFPVVVHDPNNVQRYRNILTPTRDTSVQLRLDKWRQALSDLHGHPFGLGLATIGPESTAQPILTNANADIDSGYMRIGYEQGLVVMGIYIAGLLALLTGLMRRGMQTRDRLAAGAAIGAAGTLGAFMTVMGADVLTSAPCTLAAFVVVGLGMAPFVRIPKPQPADAGALKRA